MTEELRVQPIHEVDWDYLIVLDACRYDYFKENYGNYLDGRLSKVKSRGSATPEWLTETFSGHRYNYTYITANPYINDEGLNLREMVNDIETEWHASGKFTEIYSAWQEAWDDQIGTVRPEKMKEYSLEKLEEDAGKTIIHFVQPHRPFISYEGEENHTWTPSKETDGGLKQKIFSSTKILWQPVFHSLPKGIKYRLRGISGMEDQYREFAENIGEEKLKQLYQQDLKLVLKQIKQLNQELEGKVVVTADHGESFGENYEWGHPVGSNNPVLVNVPWLEVNK